VDKKTWALEQATKAPNSCGGRRRQIF